VGGAVVSEANEVLSKGNCRTVAERRGRTRTSSKRATAGPQRSVARRRSVARKRDIGRRTRASSKRATAGPQRSVAQRRNIERKNEDQLKESNRRTAAERRAEEDVAEEGASHEGGVSSVSQKKRPTLLPTSFQIFQGQLFCLLVGKSVTVGESRYGLKSSVAECADVNGSAYIVIIGEEFVVIL